MSELKPCPFCGPGNSVVEYYQDPYGYHIVGCGRCGSHSGTRPQSDPEGKARVIASWNSRPMEDFPRTVQAAQSDREKRLETALNRIVGLDVGGEDESNNCEAWGMHLEEAIEIARAALADTTTDDNATKK